MQFRHPVLDQRLRLTVRRRGGCWQLRGNLGRWCGPRMNLGNYGAEGLARQVGAKLGQALADSGVVRWWTSLDVWVEAVSESIQWDDGDQRKTREACALVGAGDHRSSRGETALPAAVQTGHEPDQRAFSKLKA